MKREFDVSQDNTEINIDDELRAALERESGGFVSTGTYKYITNNIFFRKFQTIRAVDENSACFRISPITCLALTLDIGPVSPTSSVIVMK